LVIIALPGVQRQISEARSTADVRAGSEIVTSLVTVAAGSLQAQGGELVIPGGIGDPDGLPNRVVALAPPGSGASFATGAAGAVHDKWQDLLRKVFQPIRSAPTPGMPSVQWVCVPDDGRGYGWQWARAQALLTARRRVRDFEPQKWPQRAICTLSPRWPAEDIPPPNLQDHEQATLSATNWVKRRWQRIQGGDRFPSTLSIASAPFRRRLLMLAANDEIGNEINAVMTALHKEAHTVGGSGEARVPGLLTGSNPGAQWFSRSGGPWVYPERWQPRTLARDTGRDVGELRDVAQAGRTALNRLLKVADEHGVHRPTDYLAIVVQDLDGMGRFLGGEGVNAANVTLAVDPGEHRRVSGLLGRLAAGQRTALQRADLLGVPVYVGGDDLLAFAPATTALAAAQACHDLISPELPTASTAVLFFHYQAGLQAALTRARELLDTAKESVSGKHALAVGYLRRSGVRECSIQPWSGTNGQSSAAMFQVFGRDVAHPLSPRLVADLERDTDELAALHRRDQELYRAELTRLVGRHLGGEKAGRAQAATEVAATLLELGAGQEPAGTARVGVFLRQEAR
jgi:CRISPR-associated protein Cmr2